MSKDEIIRFIRTEGDLGILQLPEDIPVPDDGEMKARMIKAAEQLGRIGGN